jgi:hypothetical protein
MELEERTIEDLPERCQNCGATLTEGEKQRILDDDGTAALCTICATELDSVSEGDEDVEL